VLYVRRKEPRYFFANGTSEHFDIIFGADGIRSKVKEQLWGPSAPKHSGFRVLYAVSPHKLSKRAETNLVTQDYYPGSVFMSLTAGTQENAYDICIYCYREPEAHPFDWAHYAPKEELLDVIKELDYNFPVPQELKDIVTNSTRVYDWNIHDLPVLDNWTMGNNKVVLLGDSCHSTSPLLGQGANQAAIDAYSIADKLQRLQEGEFGTLENALKEYERIRQPFNKKLVSSSQMIGMVETMYYPFNIPRDLLFRSGLLIKFYESTLEPNY